MDRDHDDGPERWVAVATVAGAALAVLASAWRSAGDWLPTTDWALIELTVRDVGERLPLVGAPSSMGFHHPGPLLYLVLALPYRLLGADPVALGRAVGLLSAASVVGIGWTAWRRGRLPLVLLATVGTLWLAGSLPAGTLADPWNPWMALLPAVWLLLAVWSVLDDDPTLAPWAVGLAAFCVQAHIGYLALVGALAAAVTATFAARTLRARRARREAASGDVDGAGAPPEEHHGRRRWGRALVASAVVLAATWALPVVDQLTRDPGNLVRGWRYFSAEGEGERASLRTTAGLLATELGPRAPWLRGDEPLDGWTLVVLPSPLWHLVVPVLLLGLGWWWSRGDRSARAGVVTATAAVAGTAVALALLEEGRAFAYVVRFAWAVGLVVALTTAWAGLRRLRPALAATGVLALLAVLVVGAAVRVVVVGGDGALPVHDPVTRAFDRECVTQVWPAVVAVADGSPVHLAAEEYWPILGGSLANELDRSGVDVAVAPRLGFFTHAEGRDPRPGEVALVVVDEREVRFGWRPPEGAFEVARCDLLTEEERAEWTRIAEPPPPGLEEDPYDALRRFELTRRSDRWWVYQVPTAP